MWDKCNIDKKALTAETTKKMLSDMRNASVSSSRPKAVLITKEDKAKKRRTLTAIGENTTEASMDEDFDRELRDDDELLSRTGRRPRPTMEYRRPGETVGATWRAVSPGNRPANWSSWGTSAWTTATWSAAQWQQGDGIKPDGQAPDGQAADSHHLCGILLCLIVLSLCLGVLFTYACMQKTIVRRTTVKVYPTTITLSRSGRKFHFDPNCSSLTGRKGAKVIVQCDNCIEEMECVILLIARRKFKD